MDTYQHVNHEQYMKQRRAEYDQDGHNIPPTDMVNHPPHYNAGAVECIDAIEAALGPEGFKAYCRGNAIKYLWRAELKHTDNQDDWAKANWYINRAINKKKNDK